MNDVDKAQNSGGGEAYKHMTPADRKQFEEYEQWQKDHKHDVKHGYITNRYSSDWPCCVLFILFCVGMVVVFVYGQMEGNPSLISIGWDGNVPARGCGYTPDMERFPESTYEGLPEYPYLYFVQAPNKDEFKTLTSGDTDPTLIRETLVNLLSQGTCVSECPTMVSEVKCAPTTKMALNEACNVDPNDEKYCSCQLAEETGDGEYVDVPFRYDTVATPWGNGFCIPVITEDTNPAVLEVITQMKEQFEQGDAGDTINGWFNDIMSAWICLAISSVTAVILGYLYLFVVQLLGGYIVWVSFALIWVSLVAGGAYSWYYRDLKYRPDADMYNYLTWTSYGLWILSVVVFFLICCFRHAIKVGIAVFQTTAQYVKANLKIFVLPALSYVVIALWSAGWLYGMLWVFSVGYPEPRPADEGGMPFLTIMRWDDKTHAAFFYDVFGLFWINAFIIGVCQFVIGASACIWYFDVAGDTQGEGTVGKALHWAFRYHLGSIAFGSFLIAVCQMLRFLFEYYRKKIGTANQDNKVVKVLVCLTRYLLWLMDKCVKFISKTAYIQIALQNTWFFKSAWNGFALVIKNAHRFGAAASIGNIFMFTGMLAIMSVNGLIGYLFLTNFTFIEVASPIPPVVAICVISGSIAYGFISIFSFTTDAILQSFLLDEELRFSGKNRPQYMVVFEEELKKRAANPGCCDACCGC